MTATGEDAAIIVGVQPRQSRC